MKVIIDGAGQVGCHLAKMLSKENHSITIVDENEEVLSNLNANYDLMTVVGSPTSIRTLKEAGCASADLFIGVTPDESMNLMAGHIASQLGTKKVVVRVENPEFLQEANARFIQSMGIHSLICPEILAAREIVNTVDRPWLRQFHSFDQGELVLLGVKVREGAPILDKPLMEVFKPEDTCRIAAIKHGHRTVIPSGRDRIQVDDMVYFIASSQSIDTVRRISGKTAETVEDVMIMGGSRIALLAARQLADKFNVKIIEPNRHRCEQIKQALGDNVMVIQGDGRDVDLLHDESIDCTEAFISLTDSSETNIFSCIAAKRLGVTRTIAEVEQLDYIPMAESLDIGIVINKKLIAASHIYQMMLDADVANMKCLTFAEADVAELVVKEGSPVTRKPVRQLSIPQDVSLGGLIRNGKGIIIYGDTQIQAGDRVVVFCLSSHLHKLEKLFH